VHQECVYEANFAARPVLTEIATGRKPGDRRQAVALVGRIVVEEQQLREPGCIEG
jgi:hypothetical protein